MLVYYLGFFECTYLYTVWTSCVSHGQCDNYWFSLDLIISQRTIHEMQFSHIFPLYSDMQCFARMVHLHDLLTVVSSYMHSVSRIIVDTEGIKTCLDKINTVAI